MTVKVQDLNTARDSQEATYDMLQFDLQIMQAKYARSIKQLQRERDTLQRRIDVFTHERPPEFDIRGDSEVLRNNIDAQVKQVMGVVEKRVSDIKAEVNGVYLRSGAVADYSLDDEQNGEKFVESVYQTQVEVYGLKQQLSEMLTKNEALRQQLTYLRGSIVNLSSQKSKFALSLFEDTRNTLHAYLETDFLYVPRNDQYEETDSEYLVSDGGSYKEAEVVSVVSTQSKASRRLPPLDDKLDPQLLHAHDFCKKKQAIAQRNYDYLLYQTYNFLAYKDELYKGVVTIIKKRRPKLINSGFLNALDISENDRFVLMESVLDDGMLDTLLRLVLIDDVQFNYSDEVVQQRVGIRSKMQGLRKVYHVETGDGVF